MVLRDCRADARYRHLNGRRAGGRLGKAAREMIAVATSGGNHCCCCVVAHGAILRIRPRSPRLAGGIAANDYRAEISPLQRVQVALHANESSTPASGTSAR